MNYLIKMYSQFQRFPFGKMIFSKIVSNKAPYFNTIDPKIITLKPNYIKVSMRKRPAVHNHLKTVHAIASCNLCEYAAGICMEASIPKHRRWIPIGMDIQYLKKATTDLVAECDLSGVDWNTCTEVPCTVSVLDKNEVEVVRAVIKMKVSDKKKK